MPDIKDIITIIETGLDILKECKKLHDLLTK